MFGGRFELVKNDPTQFDQQTLIKEDVVLEKIWYPSQAEVSWG